MTIDYDTLFSGHPCVLEAGADFEHGTHITALVAVCGEARRRGVKVNVRSYRRYSEVEQCNRDVLYGRCFPVIVVQAILQGVRS